MNRFTAFLMLGISRPALNAAMPRMSVDDFVSAMRLPHRRLGLTNPVTA